MGQQQPRRRATAPTEHRRRSTDTTHPFYPLPQTAAIIGCTGQYTKLGGSRMEARPCAVGHLCGVGAARGVHGWWRWGLAAS